MPRRSSRRGVTNDPMTTSSRSSTEEYVPPKRRRTESRDDSRRRRHDYLGEDVTGRTNVVKDEAFKENMKALHTTSKKKNESQLKAVEVDFHVEINREEHHTDEYETEGLIVRRGQEFNVSVTFDRQFDAKKDKLILQLVTGSRPQQSKNSIIRVQETKTLSTSSWGMKITKKSGTTVDLSVMSPADAVVGEYSVYVETKTNVSDGKYLTFRQKRAETIVVLFNAWCKDDSVYMVNEDERNEYVLNDHGRIWVGSVRNFTGIPWNFGQFDSVSLETCLALLEMTELSPPARANPVRVCRAISQMANHNDRDGGILFGRWTETYPKNSTRPTEWVGSVSILKKFCRRYHYVRYGQCWVFSGLVTTLLRAIGIPTRSVTNFASAHDCDGSMTIDYHFDEENNPLDDLNDSVWNFHVWNESFFTRPDLPSGYDGWQAHDATPQETSEGVFRCGPCPVKAIKNGEVYMPYDTGFVFAEVNGDRVYWNVEEDGEMTVSYIDKFSIGKFISTKAVGSNQREDLTKYYKYPEGSPEERKAVIQANKFSTRKDQDIYLQSSSNDVSFEVRSEDVMIGEDFNVQLFIRNDSGEKRTIDVAIVTKVSFYTGITARDLKKVSRKVTLAGGKDTSIDLTIAFEDYVKMAPDASIKVYFKAKVKETGQGFSDIDVVEFAKPELEAEIPYDDPATDEEFEISFKFTNPLPVKLTNCILNVESSRMNPSSITKDIRKPIGPHAEVTIPVTMESKRRGKRCIEASFQSDQLSGVRGEFEIKIK